MVLTNLSQEMHQKKVLTMIKWDLSQNINKTDILELSHVSIA